MAKKTAVQCLINELRSGKNLQFEMTKCGHLITVHDNILDKILQMDKEQKKYFFECGRNFQLTGEGTFEQYYNETFGKQ